MRVFGLAMPVPIVGLMLIVLMSGCSMAPQYQRPDAPVTTAWPENYMPDGSALTEGQGGRLASDIGWRTFFTDTHLQQLITLALTNNRDLRVTALNIQRARETYRIQRADLLPSVNAGGQSSNQGIPQSISTTGESYVARQYTATVGMSGYELDFFGRVQSLKDQALEQYLATEEAMRSAQISLVAETASAWLTLIADRESLALSSETLKSQQSTYDMIKRRYEVGVSSELDLWQAQTSVDTARVNIARYGAQVAQDLAALSLLAGTAISPDMVPHQSLKEVPMWEVLPIGTPSDVLLQRPDILQAEHLLKAANANIGAARANFFPRIALSTTIGTASAELSDLFSGGTGTWSFIPQVSIPIFEGGRNLATLRVSETDKAIAVANYEKAIQSAFREVTDALILRNALEKQLDAQRSLTHAASESYRLSMQRYTQGVDSYLSALDSQRLMFSSQLALVAMRTNRENTIIQLYKVLGGGWKE